jgi:hypothetical protein
LAAVGVAIRGREDHALALGDPVDDAVERQDDLALDDVQRIDPLLRNLVRERAVGLKGHREEFEPIVVR